MSIELHPSLEPLEFLIGTWTGDGGGSYPTIESFRYREEVTFTHTGKPYLIYTQSTWSFDEGVPMHSETGYWRLKEGRNVEVMLSHPFGVTEVSEGVVSGVAIELASSSIGLTATAKEVTDIRRSILVARDTLTYETRMAAVGHPLEFHLAGELRRKVEA